MGNQRTETGDSEWTTMMSSANNLHTNFLENWYDYCLIKLLLENVEQLVDRLEGMLTSVS